MKSCFDLEPKQIVQMTNKKELRLQVGLSLQHRAKLYSERFQIAISARVVRQVYKMCNITRQKFVTRLGNPDIPMHT